MTLLIAVAGLLASIYAVLPRERRLELRLRLTRIDAVVAAFVFIAVVYCEYYKFVLSHPIHGVSLARPLTNWPRDLKPTDAADLILIFGAAITALRMHSRRLSRRSIRTFRSLLNELYWAGGYEEIFNFLERHQTELFRLRASDFWLARLRSRITFQPLLPDRELLEFLAELKGDRESQAAQIRRKARHRRVSFDLYQKLRGMRRFLPDYSESADTAAEIIHTILLSDRFATELARSRPYLAIALMEEWPADGDRDEFIHLFLWKLMEEPSSVLYTEVRNNQNLGLRGRYRLPGSNRLLNFFLSDARVAEQYNAYKPIGDYALMLLGELRQNPAIDPCSRALGYFQEHEEWKSPLYAAIRFFDIMVEEALHQNIQWHMWLYYMPPIVERMADNYRLSDPLSDPNVEWPNRYGYLIYEIFSAIRRWIADAMELPSDQANVVLKRIDSQHENDNIPKSSIRALVECLYKILVSDNIPESQKRSLTNLVFELYFELRAREKSRGYASVLLACLRDEGNHRSKRRIYVNFLHSVLAQERMEYFIKHYDYLEEFSDFIAAL